MRRDAQQQPGTSLDKERPLQRKQCGDRSKASQVALGQHQCGDERGLTHTQGPKLSKFLLNLKPTDCSDVTGNTTWPGEGISLLAKKIHLYANSIFREENVLGNATV